MRVRFDQLHPTPVWLPAGCSIAAFILFGYRVWPAVLVGSFLGHVTALGVVRASFLAPIGISLEGLMGVYLFYRFAHGVKAFDTAKGVLRFVVFTCICPPSIDAAFTFNLNYFIRHIHLMDSSRTVFEWWLAESTGILVVAPFLILLFRAPHHPLNMPEVIELTILLLGLATICLLVFGPLSASLNKYAVIRSYMCIPFLIWAAFRFCPQEAAGATFILFGSAIWGTMHGYGQFVSENSLISLVLMDFFVGINGTMTLLIAATVVQRRRIELELLAVQSLLQAAMETKNRELEVTVHALELEVAGHTHTRRTLRDNQERLRLLAENEGKVREIQIRRERVE